MVIASSSRLAGRAAVAMQPQVRLRTGRQCERLLPPHPGPLPQSVSEKWVARATRLCRSATRRPARAWLRRAKGRSHWLAMPFPFRPASRRTAQASGLCYPKSNSQTRSQGEGGRWHRSGLLPQPAALRVRSASPQAAPPFSLSPGERVGGGGERPTLAIVANPAARLPPHPGLLLQGGEGV